MNAGLKQDAIRLLQQLIEIPSFSREENITADLLNQFFEQKNIKASRHLNNVWSVNEYFSPGKPTLLLNSHHDTVKPNPAYTRDPFKAILDGNKLYGLGSNDAGGPLVALIATYLEFYSRKDLSFNLVLAATAEEEISGVNGIESLWPSLPKIDFAIVGEPTKMDIAVAEKGLMVLDCLTTGIAGHAAREEGVNAIYNALPDIEWFRTHQFPKVSPTLGPVKMSVTVIHAGQAHNQVPAECKFTVDVRATDMYTLEELHEIIRQHVGCSILPRSMRMRPSSISTKHPLVTTAINAGCKPYGSPTTSDQALIPVPSCKIGPGDSARSHAADEFILLDEIEQGIDRFVLMLNDLAAKDLSTLKGSHSK
jgi:acetylornithine deacetylase/succinyl-diaminopimelate desuccinylase-like protein